MAGSSTGATAPTEQPAKRTYVFGPPVDESNKKRSERSLWVLQLLFAVVIARGILIYDDVIIDFWQPAHWLPISALTLVIITSLLSWIDFSRTTDTHAYLLDKRADKIRFLIDFIIVMAYAYMLIVIERLKPSSELFTHPLDVLRLFAAIPLIFILYDLSGWLRVKTYGKAASSRKVIHGYIGLSFFACIIYIGSSLTTYMDRSWLYYYHIIWVAFFILLIIGYRFDRANQNRRRSP